MPSPRALSALIAGGRAAIGVALVAVPKPATSAWVGDVADSPGGEVVVRALGVRDFVLGAGGLAASLQNKPSARSWVLAAAVADTVDGLATVANAGKLPRPGAYGVVALALGSAVAGYVLATRLD